MSFLSRRYTVLSRWKIFKYMFLTFPDHNPPFPHTASRVYFLPVVHRPKSPEQQNLCPSRNLFQPRNRGGGEAQYNVQLRFSTFRVYSKIFHVVIIKSGSSTVACAVEPFPSNKLSWSGWWEAAIYRILWSMYKAWKKGIRERKQYYYNNLLVNIRKITHRLWC